MVTQKDLQDIANILRRDSLMMTSSATSGHPTSCLSCAELMSCLFFGEMSYDTRNSKDSDNDEFVLSKGHAAPILYSSLYHAGCIKDKLMDYRKLHSPLEGHPMPSSLSWVKAATGSLGQGLSIGIGMALAAKIQKRKYKTYVLMGDSECAEGSVWEASQLASYYKLDNLCAIVDINRLGQRGETMPGHHLETYEKRFESFGWEVWIVDGHDINQIMRALNEARHAKSPAVILAYTLKGKGVSFIENKNGWHGKALNASELPKALNEIPSPDFPRISIAKPKKYPASFASPIEPKFTYYNSGEMVSTREAYGHALAHHAQADNRIIALDAEVSNSTFAEEVKKILPNSFIECFVAEQNMIGMALGLSAKGFNVFASTFSAFLSRAHDQLRMSAISLEKIKVCGSHCGVSIGEDGASQMGLEDIALFRSLPHSIVLYPSDAVSSEKLLNEASKSKSIVYIRTTRSKTHVIYPNYEEFPIGDFKVIKSGSSDKVVLVGSGITLHEALKAHEMLKSHNVKAAVVDLYCIKPFNAQKFIKFAKSHGKRVVIAEDHYSQGGIGEMLASELNNTDIKLTHLSVKEIPHSGKAEELLKKYKIDAESIFHAARAKS